ncbi:MAG: serine--tRNA ligase [Candidatus Dojkabacteria bacterium]
MIDIDNLRKNPELYKKQLASGRGDSSKIDIDKWLKLDEERRGLIKESDDLKSELNIINRSLKGKPDEATLSKIQSLKLEIENRKSKIENISEKWQEILDWMPNLYLEEVPQGKGSEDNIEIKTWDPKDGYLSADKLGKENHSGQYMKQREFAVKPHWEIGKKLDIIDIEAGAKVSGSRFYYIKNEGALLIYAVFNLLMRRLIHEGFSPMIVPMLVKEKALYGSSHFPGEVDQVYKIESKYLEGGEGLYLPGSSEPSNFAYFMDNVLDKKEIPVKIMAQTPCFRTEVGSWGKDVRGIKRTHQFDKLEMNMIIEADLDKAREMQEYLLSLNEWLLQELKIPYHVINMCVGDLGYNAAAKKYDIEVWLPSEKSYMEVMSNSITTDFQTRRLNIKYKDKEGNLKFAYTLNDTGATHRLLIAIIEHYQNEDGSLTVPEALRDYVGKESIQLKENNLA